MKHAGQTHWRLVDQKQNSARQYSFRVWIVGTGTWSWSFWTHNFEAGVAPKIGFQVAPPGQTRVSETQIQKALPQRTIP